MSARIFVDSSIFLYTLDKADTKKRNQAKDLLRAASSNDKIFVSTQVLNEIFSVATRKLKVDPVSAKEFVGTLYAFDVLLLTKEIIENAMDYSILYRLNYWDALMVAAAQVANCSVLWTEDMQHNSFIREVKIMNPFLEE